MQTDSSASLTYFASVSAVEWTTTVRMPSSRHARWMRRAISPRFAIRILPNIDGPSADHEQRLTVFHRLAVFDQDLLDFAGDLGLDLVEQLHRFDDAQRVAGLHGLADFDERIGSRARRAIKGAN